MLAIAAPTEHDSAKPPVDKGARSTYAKHKVTRTLTKYEIRNTNTKYGIRHASLSASKQEALG